MVTPRSPGRALLVLVTAGTAAALPSVANAADVYPAWDHYRSAWQTVTGIG
jgi:hypothetical protein